MTMITKKQILKDADKHVSIEFYDGYANIVFDSLDDENESPKVYTERSVYCINRLNDMDLNGWKFEIEQLMKEVEYLKETMA